MTMRINMRACWGIISVTLLTVAIACFPKCVPFRGHTGEVNWVVFSPDARVFASESQDDGTIRTWDTATRKQLAVTQKDGECVSAVVFSSDGKLLAAGVEGKAIAVWDAASGKEVFRLKGHMHDIRSVAFSSDGKSLASGSVDDKTVKVWDILTAKEIFSFRSSHDRLSALTFSPNGKFLASGGWLKTGSNIQLWDMKTGIEHSTLTNCEGHLLRLLFSPDSKTLCSVDARAINLWDVITGQSRFCERPTWLRDDGEYVEALAFSPDSQILAAGHEMALGLWDVASGKNTLTYTHEGANAILSFSDRFYLDPQKQRYPLIAGAAFKSNGDLMVLGIRSKTVALWRLTTVKPKQ